MATRDADHSLPDQSKQEKLFEEARRLSSSSNARNKQAAIDACAAEHAGLLECFVNKQSFSECTEAHKAFWDCFTRERGFNRSVFSTLFAPLGGGKTDDINSGRS
mmetsp:Transcript_28933/g.81491  ORF Transcript_28933/g.81491 Transcript_28933/m.81491 type:complete len:105 (-) Transcript_28933:148-462(-)